jgi:hypothetical protein
VPFASHPVGGIAATFHADPTPFYMIGRLISAAYGVGSVVATWLVGRRVVGDVGGIMAAAFLAATPIAVEFGQIVRTDTAGTFFAVLSVWLILRAVDRKRGIDWALAAIAIGLATSTRYFFVTLAVPYAVAAWLTWRAHREAAAGADVAPNPALVAVRAAVLAPVAFALTSPFALIDFRRTLANLRTESRTVHPGADGLSPMGNLDWYLTSMLPPALGLVALALAVLGIFVILRRNRLAAIVVLAYFASYVVGISASPLHWDRYVIPMVPVIGILASAAVLACADTLVRLSTRRLVSPGARARAVDAAPNGRNLQLVGTVASGCLMAFLLVPPTLSVAAADRLKEVPSTRVMATEWALANLKDAKVVEEPYGTYLAGMNDRFALVRLSDRPVDSYRADGFDYLITSSSTWARFFAEPNRYAKEIAFYQSLPSNGRLVVTFNPDQDRGGPRIDVYDIRSP